MKLTVNGEDRRVPDNITLLQLLVEFEIDPQAVAAAVNGEIVSQHQFKQHRLSSGDRVELVRPMAGGGI